MTMPAGAEQEPLDVLRERLNATIIDSQDLLAWLRSLPGGAALVSRIDFTEAPRERWLERAHAALKWDAVLLQAALESLPDWTARRTSAVPQGSTAPTQQRVDNQGQVRGQFNTVGDLHVHHHHVPGAASPTARRSNLPARTFSFVGRAAEIDRLHQALTAGQGGASHAGPRQPVALTGMGGVGKTTLAIEYAYRHLEDYAHICWVNAQGGDFAARLCSLADDPLRLGLNGQSSSAERLQVVLSMLEAGGPHLLVLDNVTDLGSLHAHLPRTGHTSVLVTSRREDLPQVQVIRVDLLDDDDALRLLTGDVVLPPEELGAARQLCQQLGHLTLAVAVAARHLDRSRSTPSRVLARIMREGPIGLSDARRVRAAFPDVTPLDRLFDLSVSDLDPTEAEDRAALALLNLGAWCAPVEIPRDLLVGALERLEATTTSTDSIEEAVQRLSDLNLAATGPTGGPLFHRLVRAYMRQTSPMEARDAVVEAMAERVGLVRAIDIESMALTPYAAHIEELLPYITPASPDHLVRLPLAWAEHANVIAPTRLAFDVCEQYADALGISERGCDFLLLGAHYLRATDQFARALGFSERAVEIAGKQYGPIHPATTAVMSDYAVTLHGLGRRDEAFAITKNVLKVKEKIFGDEHFEVAISLHNLGLQHWARGEVGQAIAALGRSGEIKRKVLGDAHPFVAKTLTEFARLLQESGRHDAALQTYSDSLSILVRAHGECHLDVGTVLNGMGVAARQAGRNDEALGYYQRALSVRTALLGENSSEVAWTRMNIGRLLAHADRHEEAAKISEQAADSLEAILGPQHPDAALARFGVGLSRYALGDAAGQDTMEHALTVIEAAHVDDGHMARSLRLDMADMLQHGTLSVVSPPAGPVPVEEGRDDR